MNKANLKTALLVAMIFMAVGWTVTAPSFIIFLDEQHPFVILLLWYAVIFAPLLYFFGKAHFKDKFGHRHVLAVGMLYIAFSIVFFLPGSDYVNDTTSGDSGNLLVSSEDGVLYAFIHSLFGNDQVSRWITYIVVPGILSFSAVLILKPKSIKAAFQQLVK